MQDQPHSAIARRLKRANGHLEGIIEMIEQGRPCAEIAQQLQAVESAVEHGEQNSHLTLAPTAIREILNRIGNRIASPETPVIAIASSGSRCFLRQIAETALPNLYFVAHNEIPPGLRVQSLGTIA